MARGTIESKRLKNGYCKWANVSVPSANWLNNTGTAIEGISPAGISQIGNYNLSIHVAGTYLLVLHANFNIQNSTGLRGLRVFVSEENIGEYFFAAGSLGTDMTVTRLLTTDGNNNVRMGLYQSSGSTGTAADIEISAILLAEA